MNAELTAYVALTLLALYALADWIAPYHNLTEAGCRVSYVYDGDTLALDCGAETQTARLLGFDTPETKSPGCPAEAALGQKATKRLRALIDGGAVSVSGSAHDKYGRLLVRLLVDGRDVADVLVAEGLAVAYDGGTRINWCARLRAR